MGFIFSSKEKEGRRGGKASLKKRLRLGTHPNFFEHFVRFHQTLTCISVILIVLVQFVVVLKFLSWLWSSIEECLYKGNVGALGEMLSKIFQNPHFFLGHHSSKLCDSNFWAN